MLGLSLVYSIAVSSEIGHLLVIVQTGVSVLGILQGLSSKFYAMKPRRLSIGFGLSIEFVFYARRQHME